MKIGYGSGSHVSNREWRTSVVEEEVVVDIMVEVEEAADVAEVVGAWNFGLASWCRWQQALSVAFGVPTVIFRIWRRQWPL
jgi:hypothetical protein